MIIHNPILTGSFSVNGADLSTITGSVATSASFDARTTYLESTSSILTAASASQSVTSGSLVAASASLSATSGSLSAASGSFNTRVSALEATGSALSSSLLTVSGSGYSTSASLSAASGSFNSRVATIESKYATTGSNTFIGTQVVSGSILQSGSFTSTGTLTAQTLVIQTITSSVVYSSGSNVFGNSLGNSQVFTGSVLITGSLAIAGASSATSYSGTTIYGSTAVCSPVGKFTTCIDACSATFNGNTIITSTGIGYFNGCLTIGSLTGSGYRLEAINPSCLTGYVNLFYGLHTGNNTFTIKQFGANHPSVASVNQIGVLNSEQHIHLVTDIQACIDAGTSTKGIFLKSGGNVGIGMQSPSEKLEICGALKINGQLCSTTLSANSTYIDQTGGTARFLSYGPNSTTRGAITFFQASSTNAFQFTGLTLDPSGNATFGGNICSGTINGTTIYGSTAVCSPVGKFTSCIDAGIINGSGFCISAGIVGNNSNNLYLSSNSAAGEISFWGNQLNTRLMTLTGCGNLGIGTASPLFIAGFTTLQVNGTTNGLVYVTGTCSTGGHLYAGNGGVNIGASSPHPVYINTNDTSRLIISSTGIASFACQVCAPRITLNSGTSGIIDLGQIGTGGVANQIIGGQWSGYAYTGRLSFKVGTWGVGSDYGPTEQMSIEVQGADTKKSQITMAPYGGSIVSCGDSYFCGSTYGIMGFGCKVFDKTCYVMTTTGTICLPLDGLIYGSGPTRAIYIYGSLLGNDSLQYAHMVYFYRNDYGGLQAATVAQASCAHASTAGQVYTYTVNDPGGLDKSTCTVLLRLTSSGAGVAAGSYCTQMRIVVYNVPG